MRTFSRWMPSARGPSPTARPATLAILLAAATWVTVRYPWVPLAAVAVLALGWASDGRRRERFRLLAGQRASEGICTFARAFPRSERDPWLLRGVWEELRPACSYGDGVLPLRPTDRLREDLELGDDAIDDAALAIAERTGRDMRACRANPLYGRVQTVRDVVAFMHTQPRAVAA